MKVLLVNSNVAVSKLVSLGVQKLGYDFEEIANIDDELSYYDIILVDHDSEVDFDYLATKCERLIYLLPRNQEKKDGVEYLYKPFLPTDFIELLSETRAIAKNIDSENIDEELLEINDDMDIDKDIENDELLEELNLDEEEN
ncbi:hypothetical protein CINS5986_06145, partial [Campylobacter insulaenigrae]|nr:hypothetical protein [Campylobacter insulaenigrae]